MDGTFKIVPTVAYQLLTLGYISHDYFVPVLYVLMTKKSQALYASVLRHVKGIATNFSPNQFIMDFETALINASTGEFPDAQIQGCFFHFAQAVLRKFRSLGLQTFFSRSPESRRFLRLNLSVAMLPAECIPYVIENNLNPDTLSSDATEMESELLMNAHAYMIQQWKPKAELISVFNCARRTNNSMESMHSLMLKRFGTHPGFWSFLSSLNDNISSTIVMTERLNGGLPLGRLRKVKHFQNDARIAQLAQQLNTKRISPMEYLSAVSYRVASSIMESETGVGPELEPENTNSQDDNLPSAERATETITSEMSDSAAPEETTSDDTNVVAVLGDIPGTGVSVFYIIHIYNL